ncbi:MAG: bifunctional DNA primase/polymerase [Pseudomonadota bacterium]
MTSMQTEAVRYRALGYQLVAWHSADGKGPKHPGWGKRKLNPMEMNGEDMLGLNHGLSRTAVIDGDDLALARTLFGAFGIDTEAMPGDPPAYHGNPVNRRKWLYRLPEGFTPPGVKQLTLPDSKAPVFELRGCPEGKQAQDVLPPSVHPDTGKPYAWISSPMAVENLPPLPEAVVDIWSDWKRWKPILVSILTGEAPEAPKAGSGNGPNPLVAHYNEEQPVSDLLLRYGYEDCGGRYLRPGSTSGKPGTVILPPNEKYPYERAYSHDAGPLGDNKPHDAADCLRLLFHDGDWPATFSAIAEQLGVDDFEDLDASKQDDETADRVDFEDFVLKQSADAMEAQMDDDRYVIPRLAIVGQSTVLYGDSNRGKTLLTLHQVAQQIAAGEIDGSQVFYVNADDHGRGIAQKQRLAERYGFNMLVPGRERFEAHMLRPLLKARVKKGKAPDCIVILDTLKKFTDLMSKKEGSRWGVDSREFIQAGGTLISLAHTNKHKDEDGNSIYAGTADVIQDADCAYVIELVEDTDTHRTVSFRWLKDRGDVDLKRGFRYAIGVGYQEMFDSVEALDGGTVTAVREHAAFTENMVRDLAAITHIEDLIDQGVTMRSDLIAAASKSPEFSRRGITRVLDSYTGGDEGCRWDFEIGPRNSQIYHVLDGGWKTGKTGRTEFGSEGDWLDE